MVDGEIIQNVNAVATIKTGVIMIKRKKKSLFQRWIYQLQKNHRYI